MEEKSNKDEKEDFKSQSSFLENYENSFNWSF